MCKLPRRCVGAEIVEAFAAAATMSLVENERWIGVRFHRGEHTMGPDGIVAPHEGVHATPSYLRKRSRFARRLFGGEASSWETVSGGDIAMFHTHITLEPLDPRGTYDRVLVTVGHLHSWDAQMIGCCVASDPSDPAFVEYRPMFDRILRSFIAALAPATASASPAP